MNWGFWFWSLYLASKIWGSLWLCFTNTVVADSLCPYAADPNSGPHVCAADAPPTEPPPQLPPGALSMSLTSFNLLMQQYWISLLAPSIWTAVATFMLGKINRNLFFIVKDASSCRLKASHGNFWLCHITIDQWVPIPFPNHYYSFSLTAGTRVPRGPSHRNKCKPYLFWLEF